MGRLPCGMGGANKKSQWTPEEDLLLASYIQEKGTSNWSSVPNETGLKRCSRSCRLRWLNYLRPGLKQGNFTAEEDRKIIHLQAVLGNKWSAIAHYLPGRTDNHIKNRWNRHLKLIANSAVGSCSDDGQRCAGSGSNRIAADQDSDSSERSWERRLHVNVHVAKKALLDALSPPPASAAHTAATLALPLTAPELSSSVAMATAPLLSSGCMSFKPPRGLNQSAGQQQLMIPVDDHQLRSQVASQISRASTCSTTAEPYVFNCENVALWLNRWK